MRKEVSDLARIREERVDKVVEYMCRGTWYGYRSARELAAEWDCSIGAVQDYAREASSVIRHNTEDSRESIRALLVAAIDDIRERALTAEKTYVTKDGDTVTVASPELGVALKALEAKAKVLRIVDPEPPKDDKDLTTEEKRARAIEMRARIEEWLAANPEPAKLED